MSSQEPLQPTPLLCAPCLAYGKPEDAEDYDGTAAVTIMGGTALCYWHFEYAHSFQMTAHWDHRDAS